MHGLPTHHQVQPQQIVIPASAPPSQHIVVPVSAASNQQLIVPVTSHSQQLVVPVNALPTVNAGQQLVVPVAASPGQAAAAGQLVVPVHTYQIVPHYQDQDHLQQQQQQNVTTTFSPSQQSYQIVSQVVTSEPPSPAFQHPTTTNQPIKPPSSHLIIPPVHKSSPLRQDSEYSHHVSAAVSSEGSSGDTQQVFHINNGKTKAYTYEAFFASDGRSKKGPVSTAEVKAEVSTKPKYTCSECGKHYATSSNLSR